MVKKKKIVFFTGAGMSRESGLPTFRGEGGVWNDIDYEKVATLKSWYGRQRKDVKERRQAMLDFFNPLRRVILEHEPNDGHRIIAALENDFDVTVITQNGDDYHTRAGSTNVIYLHGEALKNASSANPYNSLPIDPYNPDIHVGDKAPDGSQIRPYVIYFDENIDKKLWQKAIIATKEADYFVVVGSTMLVFPAADLIRKISADCQLIVIDPGEVFVPNGCRLRFLHLKYGSSNGLNKLKSLLTEVMNNDKKSMIPGLTIDYDGTITRVLATFLMGRGKTLYPELLPGESIGTIFENNDDIAELKRNPTCANWKIFLEKYGWNDYDDRLFRFPNPSWEEAYAMAKTFSGKVVSFNLPVNRESFCETSFLCFPKAMNNILKAGYLDCDIEWESLNCLSVQATLDYPEYYGDYDSNMKVFYWSGVLDRNGFLKGKLQLHKSETETYSS